LEITAGEDFAHFSYRARNFDLAKHRITEAQATNKTSGVLGDDLTLVGGRQGWSMLKAV